MSSTELYDFCDPVQRLEWLDILIALIEYLRSGNSQVGFLNKAVEKNMLHKDRTEQNEAPVEEGDLATMGASSGKVRRRVLPISRKLSVPTRRSSRKRKLEDETHSDRNIKRWH